MQLPALLFAALAAFLIGSVSADTRPIAVPPSCSGTGQYNTGCFCTGGCGSGAQAWFSCYNAAGSKPLQDIGIRFEAGYSQPSQTRSWQISNQVGWPSGISVDQFEPNVIRGSDPSLPGPTPTVPSNTDQWYTSGVVPLNTANPTGPTMWACTKNGLLQRSSNGGFGPIQPRCYSIATGVYTAPYSQGCQESNLFDAPNSAGLQYRGWAFAGIKVKALDGSVPTPLDPGNTIIPSTPLGATELRPLPQNYAAGGVTMNCFVSLFNPCSTVVSTCPANTICVGSAAPSGNTVATCPVANCCPASSVIRPTDGSAWYCCPSGQVAVTSGTTTKCCPTGSGLDNNLNCCPNAQIVSGTRVCCPTANFDPSKPNTCCPFTVVGTTCCPVDPATVYTGTPAIPSNQNFLSGSPAVCCPTANVNDQPSTSNVACCPTTTGGNKFVDKDLSGSGQASTRFCCPTTQFITSGVTRICCPATGGPFTFTTNGQEKCCPTSQLSKCSGSPFCCPNGNPTTCVGVPADGADFFPCCPTTDVRTVSDTAGASAPRCCPGTSTTLTYVYFAGQGCCLATYVVDLTAQSGSGFTGSANGAANNKFCCPGGFGATSGPSTAVAFACSAVTSTLCTWNANSACCPTNRIASVGAVAGNRGNTLCCPSAGPFATCNSFTDCPRNPSGSNVDQINPCCPASATIVLCGTDKYCCPSGGGLECKSAGASNRRCCPTANVPLQNNVTPQDYCCPGNPGTNPFIYVDATNPCCPINRIPFLPGTTTRSYTLCCPNDGQQYVVVNSQCCLQSAAVFDTANNVWLCCPNIGSNPQVVNGNCCPRSATFNTNYCCPQFNGRSIPTGALFCPTAPTTRTDCWVNNANCQRIGGPATGCCCFAGSLTRQATNGPAVPDPAICCDAGQGLGFNNAGFFFTNQDPCCPTSRLVSTFRTTPTSADSAYCCPTTVSALPAQPIGGVTCSYYTPLPDKNGNTQTCCRNCDVSRNLAGATSTDPNARCCDNAAQIPTIVDVVASGTSSSYTRFCCPASFVFQYQGTSYCCPASIAQVPISKVINNVCCPPNQDVAIPGGSTLVCCPNYDSTKGIPVWTDLGTGGSGNCCPPNQALTFSGSGLPNVPASNATGAPTSAAPHRFCCPANQLPSGVPAPDAYIPALDAVSGSVNFNTNYNNLRCCPAANVLRVQAPNGKVYDVCCPNPNMIFNKDTGQCCPQGVIAPPCPVPYPLVGCSGSCCPPGQTGAIGTSGNPPLPTGSTQSCCPTGQIRTFLGVGYCCPSNVLPTTTGAFYNNDPTKIRPCCPVVDQLTCPASNAGCNATTAPYQLCCPAGDFPIPANVAGNTPPPSLIVDPQTGKCCRGYLNSASGPRPGGNRCCVPKAGITVYFQAADDPCCTTLVDPTDGTCCPLASYRVNAQGQALCCPANTVWATNDLKCCPIALATGRQPDGTYTDCCDDPLYTNDPGQTCCPTSTLQNGYCCPPTQLDDFGRCCLNNTTPLNKFIDTSSGVPVVVLNKSVCCDSGLKDCAGFCYFLDPADDVVKAYHVQGANNTGCCPSSSLDCAGQCPSNCANGVCTGPARNNGTITDCCPDSKRGCLNGVPNAGACGAADTNCCAQLSGRNCTACTTTPGCGWCNAIGSASGLCLSGDYFGPNAGVEGIVCNQTGGFRWTAVGESKIFQSINGFGDGRNIEYANVSVLLAKNVPIVVPFRIKAPNDLPLDLYILQDRTNSFIQPVVIPSTTPPTYIQYGALDVLKGNLDGLDAAISALVPSGYHLGFGTFGDKAVEPFGFWANSGFFDFVFQNVYPISANRAATIAAIKALDPNTFAGGNDIPEASIEALLHVAQNPVINWGTVRANSLGKNVPVNKIAIVVTDAPAHTASTNWAAYAPGVRFPNTDFPNAAPGAAQDLSFYLTPATQPSKRVALNPVDSWKAHSGVYTDTDCLASDPSTARIRQPVTAFDPARQGICTDYPSASQVATAIGVTGFTSVFAVAETVSALYPLSAGYDFWSNFSVTDLPAAGATPGLTVKLDFTKDPNAPGGLVYTIREAIKNITQSITFENTTSSQFMNTISSSFTLPPDGIQTVNVPLFWDGTDYGSTGPFPIDFQAIFPLSGYVIDVARINVYISPEKRCCFCGDGVVQNETGCDEECDNDGATDSVCCKACKIDVGQICSNDNLCVPVICEKDGKCTPKNINDECVNDVLDPFAFCQFNTCIAGSCIVTCSSDACCNDSDPCTQDSCNDLSLCQYTLLPECDCSNQAFNNCFDCVRNNNTKCAYEANSGTCFQFNETIYEQGGYGGSEINPVTDEKGISRYCIVVRPPGSKTGVIVGAVVGTLAALGLIALAAALWWRLRNGPILAPGGTANTAGAAGAAQANPTYVQPSTQTNPLHDNGGGGN